MSENDKFKPAEHTILLPHAPVIYGTDSPDVYTRWSQIKDTMAPENQILNVEALIYAMSSPGPDIRGAVKARERREVLTYETLRDYVTRVLTEEDRSHFFTKVLPFIKSLVLELEVLFPSKTIPTLRQGHGGDLTLTRRQVACLMACAFFSLFHRFVGEMYPPAFNLESMFSVTGPGKVAAIGKIGCIVQYFEALRKRETAGKFPQGNFTIRRLVLNESQRAHFTTENVTALRQFALNEFRVVPKGAIENAAGCIQADFANKYIGGGVLGSGCVQEEIRFVINPECLVSCLVCEVMADNEAIAIIGAERFSNYKGYGGAFAFAGPHVDKTEKDDQGRIATVILAIDALYAFKFNQYTEQSLMRELVKSVIGNVSFHTDLGGKDFTSFATGNWGCGVFGGDLQLKSMIQWISASLMGINLLYLPFNDKRARFLGPITKLLREKNVSAGELYRDLLHWSSTRNTELFPYLAAKYIFRQAGAGQSAASLTPASALTPEEVTALHALAKTFHRPDILHAHIRADEEADKRLLSAATDKEEREAGALTQIITDLKTKSNPRSVAAEEGASAASATEQKDDVIHRLSDSLEGLTL